MSDEIRRLAHQVRADYEIFTAGMKVLRQEFHDGLGEVRDGLGEVRDGLEGVQGSVVRLAEKLDNRFGEIADSSERMTVNLEAALQIMARQYDEVESLKARLEAVESLQSRVDAIEQRLAG